jgi:hypothetical protein
MIGALAPNRQQGFAAIPRKAVSRACARRRDCAIGIHV